MDQARSLGADHVIDYTNEDFTKGEQRYDVLFDNAASHSLSDCRRVLVPQGILVLAGVASRHGFAGILARVLIAPLLSRFVRQKLVSFIAGRLISECLKDGYLQAEPEGRLVPRGYQTIYWALYQARKKARIDPVIQPCHGFRKYFENALDQAGIDHEMKMVIEGHIAGTRARHYTERDTEQLREMYRKAYPFIDPDSEDGGGSRIGLGPGGRRFRNKRPSSKS